MHIQMYSVYLILECVLHSLSLSLSLFLSPHLPPSTLSLLAPLSSFPLPSLFLRITKG